MYFRRISAIISGIGLFLFLAASYCNSPTRPQGVSRPACWKPLVADTVGFPNPSSGDAQSGPVWSSSGKLVSYFSYYDSCNVRDPGIYIADSSGGARRRRVPVFGAYSQWLPGDTELIVNTGFGGGGELVIYNLNTDSATPMGVHTRFPIFDVSKDGRYIYYEGEPVPPHQGSSIFEFDRLAGTEWPVAEGASPGISPDRKYLAYAAGPLLLYKFSDSTIIELASNCLTPEWTPEGDKIVFGDGMGKILVVDISTAESQSITGVHSRLGAFAPVSLSPDGRRILYHQISDDFYGHIWEIDINGNGQKQFSY